MDKRTEEKSISDKLLLERYWDEAVKRKYSSLEIDLAGRAWAAGLFDGEGHASASPDQSHFNCRVDQANDNRYVLERFLAVVGVGKIKDARRKKEGNRKPACYWSVSNQKDLQHVWNVIGDFLGKAKRDQFAKALTVPIRTILKEERELPPGMIGVEVVRERESEE